MTSETCTLADISVIVTAHDDAGQLDITLDSIHHQTLKPSEVLIVDEGQLRPQHYQAIAKLANARIVSLAVQHDGPSAVVQARNAAIKAARGQHLAFIDAGDRWLPHYLEEMALLSAKHPEADILASHYQIVDGDNGFIDYPASVLAEDGEDYVLHHYFRHCHEGMRPLSSSACVFRPQGFSRFSAYLDGDTLGEADDSLFGRAAVMGRIACSTRVLALVTGHDFRDAHRCPEKPMPYINWLYAMTFPQGPARLERNEILRYVADHVLDIARREIRLGHFSQALRLLQDQRCRYHSMRQLAYRCLFSVARTARTLQG